MNNVVIFTMSGCTYCDEIKWRLEYMGVPYEEKNVGEENHAKDFEELMKVTKSDLLPVGIVGKNILIPDSSFKTIKEGALLMYRLYNGTI